MARLRRLDSCAVSDACDQLRLSARVVISSRPLTGPVCIAGRAVTVLLGPPDGGTGHAHLAASATDASGADDMIVIAHQGRSDCAGWGGNLSRAAMVRGAAGTLVDGAARDIDEAISIGYPVFATTSTPATARGRTREHDWGRRIEFAGVSVDHGDFVIADSTGVVFVPADAVDDVLSAAESIAATEATMAAEIDAGAPVTAVMGASYEEMLRDT